VLQVALQKNPELHKTIHLIPSTNGPLYRRYLFNIVKEETNLLGVSKDTADHLASYPLDLQGHDRYFVKVGVHERPFMCEYLEQGKYKPGSALAQLAKMEPKTFVPGKNLHS